MNPTALAVYLTMTTGMRLGEVCALRWSDISLHEECITVRYSLQRTVSDDSAGAKRTALTLVEPKTAPGRRTIPLTPKALELCRRMEADRDIYVGSGTSKPLDPRTLHNRFGQILTQCGLQDVHFHTLRHTFATRCVEESMDIKCISELLGHSSVIITLEKYVHVSLEVKKTSIQRIAQALE